MKPQPTRPTPSRSSPSRRSFLTKTALAGGGFLLAAAGAPRLGAAAAPAGTEAADRTPNETLRTIHRLRTIHGNFTDRDIPEETLQEILHAGVRAANASNMQCYSIVVVRNRDLMKKLCGYRGSRMLLFLADHNRLAASARSLGHDYSPDGITSFVTALIDTTLAAQTAAIAARSCGVDYLLTNGIHRGDLDRHWRLLDLPKQHCFPVIALVLGYPTQEPALLKGRFEGPGLIHEGRYHPVTPDEAAEITRVYDDDSRHLGLDYGGDWRAEGHRHYLDWMFTVWMGRPARQTGTPTQMLEVIKRLGYLDA